jgi:hypothetical protein
MISETHASTAKGSPKLTRTPKRSRKLTPTSKRSRKTDADIRTVGNLPVVLPVVRTARSASMRYSLWIGGGAAALVVGMVVLMNTQRIANEARPIPSAAQSITADSDKDASQRTGRVAAAVSEEPTPKLPEAASALTEAPPASAQRSPLSEVSSAEIPAAPDDLTTKMVRAQDDVTPDAGSALPTQVPSVQASTAPAPAELAPAQFTAAPLLEPKLPPSSADSTQASQDRSERLPSEAAGVPAQEVIPSDGLTSSLPVKDARFYREKGTAAYRQGDVALAIADFDLAIRLDPNFKSAYVDRGLAFYRIGDFNHAFADIAQAMRIENSNRITTPPLPKASPLSSQDRSRAGPSH